IVTSDNPRTEEPDFIIRDILDGMGDAMAEYVVIENRRDAIEYAIKHARKDDVIVLAGKGHEDYQILKDKTIHFDEREIIREILSKM
ncbi:MAG: UDP-N-acetylmuramoyl-L-alanyl-D-glutamate--2,6-diaminopimelate ligase, partial [Clostridia bacterium]|nr:UDP-N-acetylmuramoyl-L-alanyl-D-glutamate--2,6-diaminopimelate ligase [Clostridia bacterium]